MNRKLATGLTALALLLGLTGCAPSRESAEQAADNALTAVQKWDEKTAGAYFGSEILQGGEEAPEETASAADDAMEQMMPRFTEGLSWTFTDVKEEGDSAAITAEITNRDLGVLIAAFLQDAFSQMMSTIFLPEDQQPTEEEQTAALADILSGLLDSQDIQTVTNTVTLELTYEEDHWKIAPSFELVNAIFGGMYGSLQDLGQDLG